MTLRLLVALGICFLTTSFLSAQTQRVEFGKNRVQYHDDFEEWLEYESRNFVTYFYGKSRRVAESVVMLAEQNFSEVQRLLEHRINDKIEILVYTDLTDVKQSNIGNEEVFTNTGGNTKIVGNKIFVYFNGDHNELENQIREGIASVFLQSMLFGANFQEIVQNAVLLHLPDWFEKGLVSFAGETWSKELDNRLRDIILNEVYEDFEEFSEVDPKFAGHAMWYYIFHNYGKTTVSNLLYLTRINRSVENGFLYVMGTPLEQVSQSWQSYFRERFQEETASMQPREQAPIEIRNKRNLPMPNVKLSPDGRRIAYVLNEIGRAKVYVQDLTTGKREVIFKHGFRNAFQATDYNYPALAWKPNGQELAILYEKQDEIKLMFYNTETGKKDVTLIPPQYQRIYSMDFIDNFNAIFSASVDGYSDLFLYRSQTRQSTRLTSDFHDDLDAVAVQLEGRSGIVFASNRPDASLLPERLDTTLPTGAYDLFYLSLEGAQRELVRITHTPHINERFPQAVDTTWFTYLSDASGLQNRGYGYIKDVFSHYNQRLYLNDGSEIVLHQDSTLSELDSSMIDSTILEPVYVKKGFVHNATDHPFSTMDQHTAPRAGRLLEKVYRNGSTLLFVQPLKPEKKQPASLTRYQELEYGPRHNPPPPPSPDTLPGAKQDTMPPSGGQILPPKEEKPIQLEEVPAEKQDTGKVDIDNYLFQSEFDDEEEEQGYDFLSEFEESEEQKAAVEKQTEDQLIALQRLEQLALSPADRRPSVDQFMPSRITPYRLKFRMDYFTTQADNNLLFDGLDSYTGLRQQFDFMPAGILLKANFKDLMEDYELEGGTRIPLTFDGTEFFVVYDNKKKRVDHRFALYRRLQRDAQDQANLPIRNKEVTLIGLYQWRYPFDIFRSLRATSTFRLDESVLMSSNLPTHEFPTERVQRLGLRLEYVFDNTLNVDINILNGTRYKISAEVVKRFEVNFGGGDAVFDLGEGFMTVIGMDARHYQRFLKHSVLAGRVAGATSFGAEKILYLLGGTENWLFPSFNQGLNAPPPGEFGFQSLAANMRGFPQNIRNGNSYLLANAELRVPIFKYFSKRLRSNFLRNFQLIGFFDAGTAWEGNNPFSDENPLNTLEVPEPGTVPNPLVRVRVNYFRDPVVLGYGVGVRTMLFGYFVRFDYAWGVESQQVLDPRLHISLGTDF